MKQKLYFDTRDFEDRFFKYALRTVPKLVEEGLRIAGEELKDDADNIAPKTPKKEGILKSSGKVSAVKLDIGGTSVEVVYDMPYATRVHEGEEDWKWSEPQSGPKYLESKMIKFKDKYISMIAENIRSKS